MKAKSKEFGKVAGKMKGPAKSKKADGASLKKGLVMEQSEKKEASDADSADHMEDAKDAGGPSGSAPKKPAMSENLLKHQSHIHEAAGLIHKK